MLKSMKQVDGPNVVVDNIQPRMVAPTTVYYLNLSSLTI